MISLEPKTKKLVKLVGKIFLGIIVAGTVAWFLVINPYLISQEKKRFEAASVELDKLAQEIQSKVGLSQEVKEEYSCDRPNQKFSKGPLSCDVGYKLIYADESASGSMERVSTISQISSEPLRAGSIGMETANFNENNKRQKIFQDIKSIQEFSCFISYEYHTSQFEVIVSCGGSARSEYYPPQD